MACPLSRKQRCFSCSHTTPLCTHVLLVDRLLPFVRLTAGANAGFTVTGACRAGGTPASFSQKQLALGVSRANPQDKHVHTYLAPPTTFLLLPQSCPDELRALTCLPARASPKKPPDLPIFSAEAFRSAQRRLLEANLEDLRALRARRRLGEKHYLDFSILASALYRVVSLCVVMCTILC